MEQVIEVVEKLLANDVTGIALAVIKDARVILCEGFGVDDLQDSPPVSSGTAFPAQSLTKPVLATAVMHFVETGDIALDEPVNAHLRDTRLKNSWEKEFPVTVRHLLTHTAGLPEWTGWHSTISVEDEVANHLATEVRPGTHMIYSNGGYDTLGCLLSSLAGEPWDRAVTELVLEPLGMSSSAIGTPPENWIDRATGHVRSQFDNTFLRIQAPPWPYEPPPPSGSLVSTVEDLARFLIAHFGGAGGIGSPNTVADMHRLHAALGPGGGGMGLGFRVDRRRGRDFICHGGDGVGFTNFIGGYPVEGAGVVVLINTAGASRPDPGWLVPPWVLFSTNASIPARAGWLKEPFLATDLRTGASVQRSNRAMAKQVLQRYLAQSSLERQQASLFHSTSVGWAKEGCSTAGSSISSQMRMEVGACTEASTLSSSLPTRRRSCVCRRSWTNGPNWMDVGAVPPKHRLARCQWIYK